jgi:hypothetical protein
MKEKNLEQLELSIGIYYGIDEETDEIVFDEDSMREEFEEKLKELLTN